jgi:hypothetical protein
VCVWQLSSIAQLAGRPEPIRSSMVSTDDTGVDSLAELPDTEHTTGVPPSTPASTSAAIPKEIWRLVDALSTSMDTPGLFTQSGVDVEMAVVRDCIDSGAEFDPSFRFVVSTGLSCWWESCCWF